MSILFEKLLTERRVLVSDGATGTNLQKAGLTAGAAPEDWVIDFPDRLVALHRAFVEAGSDLVLTCTFGGNPIRLKRSPYAARAAEVNRAAVGLVRQAAQEAGRDVLVGGSMGPTGEMMEPYGDLTAAVVADAFALQAAALADGGVDFLVLETFFALEEAEAALEGVRRVSALPLVMTFSYDRGTKTMMGVTPTKMWKKFAGEGLAAVGANCGTTLENMEAIVKELAALEPGIPIWSKPNAGVPSGSPAVFPVDPPAMSAFAVRLVEAGASIVGGCCGNTPEHVGAIAGAVRGLHHK